MSGERPIKIGACYGEIPSWPKIGDTKRVKVTAYDPDTPLGRRPVAVSAGCHLRGMALPCVDPDDVATVEAAVYKRVAAKPPTPDEATLERFRKFVDNWIREHFRPLKDVDVSFAAWIESRPYSQMRKEKFKKIWELAKDTDWTSLSPKHKYFKVLSFIKDECYVDWKHARGINSRSDEFKCYSGPIFSAIEKVVFQRKEFIKKIPIAERPAYIMKHLYCEGATYYATDYTAFEANFTRKFMECCEFQLYDYMTEELTGGKEWSGMMRKILGGKNYCRFKRVKYEIEATRMSGEMCTSLGNGFSNLMIVLFVAHESGVSPDHFAGVVEGDDGLFRCKTSANGAKLNTKLFTDLGLMIKIEEHAVLSEASFCGLVFDVNDQINVTDPREVLANFGWVNARYVKAKRGKLIGLLRCKALSFAHQYPGCPIIDALAHYGLAVSRRYKCFASSYAKSRCLSEWDKQQLLDALADEEKLKPREPPIATRRLVEKLYGITIEEQIEIEEMLRDKAARGDLSELDIKLRGCPASWTEYYDRYVITPVDPFNPGPLWWYHKDFDWCPLIKDRRPPRVSMEHLTSRRCGASSPPSSQSARPRLS